MADIATVFQIPQIGLETTPGTAAAANRILQSIEIKPGIKANIQKFRAAGYKFDTAAAEGKEWSESAISGIGDYNELIWMLASLLTKVTPTGSGTDKTWDMAPAVNGADSPATYTLEYGSSVRALRATYGIVTGLTLTIGADQIGLSGTMLSKAVQDAITMTASPIAASPMPMLSSQVDAYLADTQAGLTSATALTRFLSGSLEISGRYGPIWALRSSNGGYAAHIELVPTCTLKMKLEADDTGMGLLTTMRTGASKFIRFKATGPQISTGVNYLFQSDLCGKVTAVGTFEDVDGVYAIEWTFSGAYDPTWGKALDIKLINTVSAL